MLEVIEACGFELPLVLVPRETALDDRLEKNRKLSPERRAQRLLARLDKDGGDGWLKPRSKFDPYGVLRALDRHRVSYVTDRRLRARRAGHRGDHARYRHRALDARQRTSAASRPPSTRSARNEQTEASSHSTRPSPAPQPVIELTTDHGEVKVVPTPAGTRGYDDLRRAANREPLGRGVRPSVASIGDLARMASALGGEQHLARAQAAPAPRRARARPHPIHRTLGARASQATAPRVPDLAVSSAGRQPPSHPPGRRDVPRQRPDVGAVAARGALDDLAVAEPERDVTARAVLDAEEDQVGGLVAARGRVGADTPRRQRPSPAACPPAGGVRSRSTGSRSSGRCRSLPGRTPSARTSSSRRSCPPARGSACPAPSRRDRLEARGCR